MVTIDKSVLFRHYWNMLAPNAPVPVPEYKFHSARKWRFDWAWPDCKIAVEIEGNAWHVQGGGRHMQDTDMEKYNAAASLGWRVFRFSPGMLNRDAVGCIEIVTAALRLLDAIDEADLTHTCGECGAEEMQVGPGKWQCVVCRR